MQRFGSLNICVDNFTSANQFLIDAKITIAARIVSVCSDTLLCALESKHSLDLNYLTASKLIKI